MRSKNEIEFEINVIESREDALDAQGLKLPDNERIRLVYLKAELNRAVKGEAVTELMVRTC